MNNFTINDRVRIIATPCRWFDATGTIIDTAGSQFRVDVPGGPAWFGPHELVKAEMGGGGRVTRTRASAKKAGSSFERSIADYLAKVLEDDRIDRRVKRGADDRGDIAGVRVHGQRLVIEAKDYGGRIMPGPWIQEAQTEAGNDDALLGCVVAKRRGTTDPGQMFVLMTLADLVCLLTGNRDHTHQEDI